MSRSIVQALRQIRRHRRLSLTIVAIMALCIGSCVAIASVVRAVLLDDWGYVDQDRVAILWHARPNVSGVVGVGPSDYVAYRSSLQTVDHVAAVTTRGFNLGGAPSQRITCARMTPAMFPLLGVPPSRGRWFSEDDDRGHAKVVVLSERLRRTSMADRTDALDTEIALDGVPHRVVGVMPASFAFPPEGVQSLQPADCWVPASFTTAELAIPSFSYVLFARLKHGVSIEAAAADAHAGAQRIWSGYPAALQSQIHLTARVVPLSEQALARSRTPLALYAAAVAGLLLIGCANVSNLILTGLDARGNELAVRASLGATRGALLGQLLFESIVLAVVGGLAGIVIAEGLLTAMIATNAAAFPRLAEARIDAISVLVAVGCGILAGIAGALPVLLRARRGADGPPNGNRTVARGLAGGLRSALIAVELALAVSVLVVAGMLARSVISLNAVDAGFAPNGLLTFSVAVPATSHPTRESVLAFGDEVMRRLRAAGGVAGVAVSSAAPVGEAASGVVFKTGSAAPDYKPSLMHVVSPGYATALGLTIRQGRFLEDSDVETAPASAVINESLARALFADVPPIGQTFLRIGSNRTHTVVGVVRDVKQAGPQRAAPPALYVPMAQAEQPVRTLNFVLRSRASLNATARDVRRVVAGVDATLPAFAMRSGSDLLHTTIAMQRFNVFVVTAFAIMAIVLALSGLYAVLSHAVHQTRRDTGIRMALGASGRRIVRTIVARGLLPAVAGIVIGSAGAAAGSELIRSLLFGVTPNDPATLAAAASLILLASIVAVMIPASKAARVDLVTLLRHE
jgi:predicted permease